MARAGFGERAERLEVLAADLDTWSPANDVLRGVSLLDDDFPAAAAAARATADRFSTAGRGLRAAGERAARAAGVIAVPAAASGGAAPGGVWSGAAAEVAGQTAGQVGRDTTGAAGGFERVAALLVEHVGVLDAAGARERALLEQLHHCAEQLAWSGPIPTPAAAAQRVAAAAALGDAAALLRQVEHAEQTLAAHLRTIATPASSDPTGSDPTGSAPTGPVGGSGLPQLDAGPAPTAVPLIDDPPPGQSGITVGWGTTTHVLNPADTDRAVANLDYGALTGSGIGALAGGAIPGAVLAGGALGLKKLITDNRTPAGVRIDVVANHIVAVRGR